MIGHVSDGQFAALLMIGLVGVVAFVLLWALETSGPPPTRGIDLFDVPPPEVSTGPLRPLMPTAGVQVIQTTGMPDGFDPPSASLRLPPPDIDDGPPESVWLGDLSGWQLTADHGQAYVEHRCGHRVQVRPFGSAYLANVIVDIVLPHRESGCER